MNRLRAIQVARAKTLDELKRADLAGWKRVVVYSSEAAEGFLLDRINPNWKDEYFEQMLSLGPYFERALSTTSKRPPQQPPS